MAQVSMMAVLIIQISYGVLFSVITVVTERTGLFVNAPSYQALATGIILYFAFSADGPSIRNGLVYIQGLHGNQSQMFLHPPLSQ